MFPCYGTEFRWRNRLPDLVLLIFLIPKYLNSICFLLKDQSLVVLSLYAFSSYIFVASSIQNMQVHNLYYFTFQCLTLDIYVFNFVSTIYSFFFK